MMSNALRSSVGAETSLHDLQGKIKQDLGIEEYTDPDPTPMIPHTFVLEPGLKIYKIYNGYWHWGLGKCVTPSMVMGFSLRPVSIHELLTQPGFSPLFL
jgi:hypothetical protein